MRVTIDTRKTIEQNAADYFERAKKARKKAEGARKAVEIAAAKLREHSTVVEEKVKREARPRRALEWYERFRWFVSSDGFLCIGGRDASTNELVVKKHALPGDFALHTDMAGAPFVIVKAEGKEVPVTTLEEAAQFCASFSRAWKNGFSYLEVFCVTPSQLSKEPNPGEFLPKGAFMVRGQLRYFKPPVELCIGKDERGRAIVGPQRAVLAHSPRAHLVLQGNEKTSDVAKRLATLLDVDVDDIVPLLPPGGVKLGKELRASHVAQK